MEEIALVPAIECLLAQSDEEKRRQGIDLVVNSIGTIGGLLSDILPLISPEKHPGREKLMHLLSAMVCFYTQRYDECVRHSIMAQEVWFESSETADPSLSLYFTESRNRVIRAYIERVGKTNTNSNTLTSSNEQNEYLHLFMQKVAEKEPSGSLSLLGIFIATRDLSAIEEFFKHNERALHEDSTMKFVLDGAKREDFYWQLLEVLCGLWENKKEEKYSSLFYRAICDGYLVKKNEDGLVNLISDLSEKRKEIALLLSFTLHDKSSVLSQKISSRISNGSAHSLLKGEFQAKMYQKFLTENNKTNFSLLAELSKSQSSKLSMNHMALSFCNGIMNGKTCNDTFLRKNIDWMKEAKNWSKFVVASSFGMVHTDSEDPFKVLEYYMPMASIRESEKDEPESGGALFALGLICVNSPSTVDGFLSTFLEAELNGNRPYIMYGACIGLGLARLGTADLETIDTFKNILYADSVVISEAAGYSIGLVGAGTFNHEIASELLTYATQTEHEKLTRAAGIAISLHCACAAFSRPTEQLTCILEEMLGSSDPVIRYSGVLSLGSAYVGTANLSSVRRLLSIISIDSSEDVKRIAVFATGLVLAKRLDEKGKEKEGELFSILEPLAQSHSAYVRAGVALTLGMFLAGSGDKKVLEVLEVLMYDSVTYVRQHASIGAGFLLMQKNTKDDQFYRRVIEHMHSMTHRKSEGGAARFGALLGRAILDSCGRNGTIGVYGISGDISLKSVCGTLLFSQFWYWFPTVPFITLCMQPTLLLAVDTNLQLIESFQVEVRGSENDSKITTVIPNEGKKHKKFKTVPLAGEKQPQEEEQEKEKEEEKTESYWVKNFERLTPAQHALSSIAGQPKIIFMPAPETENTTQ